MKKDKPLLDPNRKSNLVNLDSPLESQFNQDDSEKEETSSENEMATHQDQVNVDVNNSGIEKTIEVEQSFLEWGLENQVDQGENQDLIPVAYRILGDKKPLLDIILTPWGIFAVIFFFLANAIIFLNINTESPTGSSLNSQSEKSSEVVSQEGENTMNQQVSLNQESKSESAQTPFSQSNDHNNLTAENSTAVHQNMPPTIPNFAEPVSSPPPPLYASVPKVIVNKELSPYPDLATALLSNLPSQNQDNPRLEQQSPPQPMASPPPPPLETNIHSSVPTNSESQRDNLQYYVVSEFKDMPSFEQIKNIVPNAFITNIEAEMKIQLGVFDNEIDANNLVEKLKQQQINASVYDSPKLQ